MWTNYKHATRYGTRSPMVDEDRGRLAWQRLLKPFDVVVACNWVAFSATNEVLSYCSLCQFRIQANFGCCCCGFSSFSLRPSIDVARDGHVRRWTSSPLLHAVEAPGTFLWHFLGTSGIYVDADQITKWSMHDDPSKNEHLFVSHAWGGVLSAVVKVMSQRSSMSSTSLSFSCSVNVTFNRHNSAKLRKKRDLLFSLLPSEKKTGLATCQWPSISWGQALATRRSGQMRGKFNRHLYWCRPGSTEWIGIAFPPPPFFLFTTP